MADLTPEEQRFFETGELQVGMNAPDASGQPLDPVALAGIVTPAADTSVITPSIIATPEPIVIPPQSVQPDAVEVLRQSLAEAQHRATQLETYIQTTQQQQTPPPVAAPDPNTDPLGSMMHQLDAVNKTVQDLQNALLTQQNQQTQLTQFNNFQQQVRALRDQFATQHTDFADAHTYLREARIADLRSLGLPDQQVQQALFREELALAESSIRFGRNPAEALYEMSKRHGYTPKTVATTAPGQVALPDTKLAAIKQAQTAARNLPKSANPEDLTVDGLKDASDSDLNKMVLDSKLWAKIVGSDQYPI